MKKRTIYFSFLLLISITINAQTVSGTVKEDYGEPLENANVIARAKDGKKDIKFTCSD